MAQTDPIHWYALRVTYCRELKAQTELQALGIESYIPMVDRCEVKDGKRLHKRVPAIHNLLFVRCSPACLARLKAHPAFASWRWLTDRQTRKPLIIPESQMWPFMAVTRQTDQPVIYLDPAELKLVRGTRVRILGGLFAGVEGIFTRIRHDRRVVVSIDGVTAVATAFIHPSLVEPLE